MQNENTHADARHDHDRREAEGRPADAPTECGLTRDELRALVVEMIG